MFYFFYNTPFSVGTQLDQVDVFVGDGSTKTFQLVNNTAGTLGSTITFNNTQYAQYSGGFTKNSTNNTIALATAPPAGSNGVAPGVAAITGAAFDNAVTGVANSQVVQIPFWYGDPYNINQFTYAGFPTDPGIEIQVVNETPGFGAQASWCQLACAAVNGSPLAFQASGTPLYVAPINTYGSLLASSAAGASSIFCATASTFVAGDYIAINVGQLNFELCQISNVAGTSYRLDIAGGGPNFAHNPGELIYTAVRGGWIQVTIPTNQTNNTAANYYNLALRRKGIIGARP